MWLILCPFEMDTSALRERLQIVHLNGLEREKEMKENEKKSEIVKADSTKSVIYYEGKFSTSFKPEILNFVDKKTIPLLNQFEKISKDENLGEWKKAHLMGKIWVRYAALNGGKKAQKKDLLGLFREGRSNFFALMQASEWVKVDDKGNLQVPSDINGITFTRSNYSMIHNFEKEINEGFFTADMSQSELREKVKLLKAGVIEEEEPTKEEPTEEPTEEGESEIEL